MNTKMNFAQAIKAGAMAAVLAAIANAVLFLLFHAAGIIVDSIEIQPGQPMTVVPVVISSILPTIIASIVCFMLEKYTNNGFGIFRVVSVVLLLLSFINPFAGIPGVTIGYAVALNVMHVVVVAFLLFFLGKAKHQS
jgi:hypothetical protein